MLDTPTPPPSTPLGELIAEVYAEMLSLYNDPDLAAVATAAVVNDLLAGGYK